MICSSVVRLKRIEIIISSLVLSLTSQLKANDCVWSNFVYLFTYANEGRESKTKDSVCNTHLNFRSFFSGKKNVHYTWVNTVIGTFKQKKRNTFTFFWY